MAKNPLNLDWQYLDAEGNWLDKKWATLPIVDADDERRVAIREKHRARYVAAQKAAKPAGKRAVSGIYTGVRGGFEEAKHPRDEDGQWTEGGSSGTGSAGDRPAKAGGKGTGRPASESAKDAGSDHGGLSGAYAGGSPASVQGSGRLKGATLKQTYAPTEQGAADLKAKGATPITFQELGEGGGKVYAAAVNDAKASSTFGAAVTAYGADDYDKLSTFISDDGNVGFALDGDNIVSAFKNSASDADDAARSMLTLAVEKGGRRLDCFDTVLPRIYGENGFKAVARLPFDEKYQPDDWDQQTFKKFNDGKPDVVFMTYEAGAGSYKAGDGKTVATYDEGIEAQRDALKGK